MAPAFAVWITGLPASGKSTLTRALLREFAWRGLDVAVLESDVLRRVLTPHPSYSDAERDTFYRAIGYIGSLLVKHGVPVVFDATGNRRAYRAAARAAIVRFVEVFVDCPLSACVARDPKGLYRAAATGRAPNVPGLRTAYERPDHPDLVVDGSGDARDGARSIVRTLQERGYVAQDAASGT